MERIAVAGLAILASLALLAAYSLFAFRYFVLPVFLLVLPALALAGTLTAAGTVVFTLCGPRRRRPATITPTMVSDNAVPLFVPRRTGAARRDHAWPAYLPGQAQADFWAVLGRLGSLARNGWQPVRHLIPHLQDLLAERLQIALAVLGWPLVALLFGGCFAWYAGVLLGGLVLLLLSALLVGALEAIRLAMVAAAHGLDSLARSLIGGPASCPVCYELVPLPWFRCANGECDRTHHDLRPGALGAWWRRCGCGQMLPTTVFRAARRSTSYCPGCSADLREHAATVPEVRVPIIGAVSAGKTRLTFAALLDLGELDFVDDESRQVFADGRRIIRERAETAKTAAGHFPHAVTVRLTIRRRVGVPGSQAHLHLFDAAGEFFQNWADNAALAFLDNATSPVFVLDPFTVPAVRAAAGPALLDRAHPATREAEDTYQLTVQRLRLYRVPIDRLPLAVAVVKADLLAELPATAELEPVDEAIRTWLFEAGLDNLVLAADRDFGEVRYFLVSSLDGWTPGHPLSAAAPLRWLMRRRGINPREPEAR